MSIFIFILPLVIALPLILALFMKKDYSISREIVIEKPLQDCYQYLRFIKNQDEFSVWNNLDPKMEKNYSGTDGTVGFTYSWNSTNKKAGQGEQTISSLIENERIVCNLHFIKPFEGNSVATFKLEPNFATATKISWTIESTMKYPMNFMLLFINMEKMIGTDLAEGLQNLKGVLEK